MEIVSNLQDKYGINNPIFIDEIRLMFNNYSKIRVAQLIQESIASGKLANCGKQGLWCTWLERDGRITWIH